VVRLATGTCLGSVQGTLSLTALLEPAKGDIPPPISAPDARTPGMLAILGAISRFQNLSFPFTLCFGEVFARIPSQVCFQKVLRFRQRNLVGALTLYL